MEEREQNQDDKTEEPTEERRRRFREEGRLPSSREILSAASLIFLAGIAFFFGSRLLSALTSIFSSAWNLIPNALVSEQSLRSDLFIALKPIALPIAISISVAATAPTLVGLGLSRFNWSWKKLEFDLSKMNPVQGISNIFGKNIIFSTFKSILKAVLILGVSYVVIRMEFFKSIGFLHSDPLMSIEVAGKGLMNLLLAGCIATLAIGIIDFAWNVFANERQLMMTKDEVKKEIKYQEGDPLYKSQRRRFARDVLLRASIDKVATATFVVTNPTHYSVAIRYASDLQAPVIVSKGQDYMALRIRQIAKTNDIMVVENKMLARALYKTVEIGQEVPPSLYLAVIEILKSIYRARGRDYFERYGIATRFA